MTNLCTLMRIRHAPKTSQSPCRSTKGIADVQNKNIGTPIKDCFYKTLRENWSQHVLMNAYGHISLSTIIRA